MSDLHPPGWLPVLEIFDHWREPIHAPYLEDFLGDRLWRQAGAAPGVRAGLVRAALSPEIQFIEDPLAGQVPFQPRFLHHECKIIWNDRGAGAWVQEPLPEEWEVRNNALRLAMLTRDELFEEGEFTVSQRSALIEAPLSNESQTESRYGANRADRIALMEASPLNAIKKERLAGVLTQVARLQRGGTGFLKEAYNLFDIGPDVRGVVWDLTLANVPKTLFSTFVLNQDQWQSFRVFRSAPEESQVRSEFEIVLGNGWTQYALVFTDGVGIEFRHYRNMKPGQRGKLERRWNKVLDSGRLTVADMVAIEHIQNEIRAVTALSQEAGQSRPKDEDASRISQLEKEIEAIKASKSNLTDEEETEKGDLEKQLFYERVSLVWPGNQPTLFNAILDVTFSFHRRGIIGVHFGNGKGGSTANYIEIKGITKTFALGTMLPRNCRVMIRSNGGKFSIAQGNPDFTQRGLLWGQPFSLPYSIGPTASEDGRRFVSNEACSVELDAVGVGEENAAPGDVLALLPRCEVSARLEELEALEVDEETGAVITPARYRVCLETKAGADPKTGRRPYCPEIYRGTLSARGAAAPPLAPAVWDSRQKRHPLSDVILQEDDARAAMHEIYLDNNTRKDAQLPFDLDGRRARLTAYNIETREKVVLLEAGVLKSPGHSDVARFIQTDGEDKWIAATPRAGSSTKLTLMGLDNLLDRPVRVQLIGNGRPPTAYVRDLILAHGLNDEFVAELPDDDVEGLERLPRASAGKMADLKPQIGASLLNFIRADVVGKHCFGWRFRVHPTRHCLLERDADADRPDLAFSTRLPHSHPLAVLGPLHFRQDTSDYFTEVLVLGAYNPARGERFSSYWRRYEATQKKGSAYFTGVDYTFIAEPDESLKGQTKCDLYARHIDAKKGLPPIVTDAPVWWHPDLRTGLNIWLDGVKWSVRGVARSGLQIAARQRATLSLRLAEDVAILTTE